VGNLESDLRVIAITTIVREIGSREQAAAVPLKPNSRTANISFAFEVADIKRPGSNVTIVESSWMVKKAPAAEGLAREGIDTGVV